MAMLAAILMLLRWGVELVLGLLNMRHVQANAGSIPEPYRDVMDEATYFRSVSYTLAKVRFGLFRDFLDLMILMAVLLSGVLPWVWQEFIRHFGTSVWALAFFLFGLAAALSLPGLPFDWHAQFRIEETFGFNTATPGVWWMDRLKGFVLGLLLAVPLLALVLQVIVWFGANWWLWAWLVVVAYQLVLTLLAPSLIMPLFNKFAPLAEGTLKQRLSDLARRTNFPARKIEIMDGSKRSRHSNAFFTGFGKFRKIVLFDTLVTQLTEQELESVLAHEIGHYRRRHIPKFMLMSVVGLFLAFAALGWLSRQSGLYSAFGFSIPTEITAAGMVPALLLFALLAGTVSFWFSPLLNHWSRRFEYEADAFAVQVMKESVPLRNALRKLGSENLSNPVPHPYYSRFYYSHPTLLEREQRLGSVPA